MYLNRKSCSIETTDTAHIFRRFKGRLPSSLVQHKVRNISCSEESIDRTARLFDRYLNRYGERGQEVAIAIRELLHNFGQHSHGYDPEQTVQVHSFLATGRKKNFLLLYVGTETDVVYDPNIQKSEGYRGHGHNIITEFADFFLVDKHTKESTGAGATVYFKLKRTA